MNAPKSQSYYRKDRTAKRVGLKEQPRNQNGNIVTKNEAGHEIVLPGNGTLSSSDRARIFGAVPKGNTISRASKRHNHPLNKKKG